MTRQAATSILLGAAPIATGPIFATLVAVTLIFARRAIVHQRTAVSASTVESRVGGISDVAKGA